jgi:hypothetical protein
VTTVWALRGDSRRGVAAGLLCGALAYVYYFYWVAALGAVLLLLALAWPLWRRLAVVAATAIAVDVPYFVLTARADPSGAERPLLERSGGTFTHHTSASHLALALILVLALAAYVRWSGAGARGERTTLVLLAALAAAAVGTNLPVLTGFDPVASHFVLRVLKPAGFLLAALLVVRALPRWRLAGLAAPAAAAGLVAIGFVRQYDVSQRTLAAYRTDTPRARVMLWLRHHTAPGDVVATTDSRFISELASVSGNKLFVPAGLRTHVSNDEILDRYLLAAKLEGRPRRAARRALTDRPGSPVWINLSWVLFESDYGYRAQAAQRAAKRRPPLGSRRLDYLIERRSAPPRAGVVFTAGPWRLVRF